MGMCSIDLTALIFQAHGVGVFAIDSGVSMARAVVTETNAVAVVDGVAHLAAPHAFFGVPSAFFSNAVANGGADLPDSCIREGRGDMEGGVNVTL